MSAPILQLMPQALSGATGNTGWDMLVKSMQGALDDRSHVTNLGYAVAVILFVWINYRLAKRIMRWLDTPKHPG